MQSDIRMGSFAAIADGDLTGKEGYLVVMGQKSDKPVLALPAAIDDLSAYVVLEGAADAKAIAVEPLAAGRQVRLKLKGTCDAGDVLVNADPTTPADAGKVRALPADAGTYRGIGIAEEKGADGQLLLVRPAALGNITVGS